jgi:hypothetical protein
MKSTRSPHSRFAPITFSIVVVLAMVTLPKSARLEAADADWKAGLASIKISPDKPVMLAGYASRNHPFDRIETDIFAKALALEDTNGYRAVVITTDLVGLAARVSEPICERIEKKTGLKREQILINSSHIHTGPTLDLSELRRGSFSEQDAKNTAEYTRQLQDKLVEVAERALSQMQPARLSWSSGVAHFAMNRREFTTNGVILGVNARGPVDRSVPVLRIDSPDGKPRAVIFGYACHNTTLTQNDYMLCGDYAGYAQNFVEQRYGGVQAMFVIGCAGDANPYPRGNLEISREHGNALGTEVCRVMETKLRPIHGPLRCMFDFAALPLEQNSREQLEKLAREGNSLQKDTAKQMVAALDRGESLLKEYRAPTAVWQFGNDLTFVGMSGEVVVDYVPMIERALGPLQLWISAYCNDVFGYVPSARTLREGGYETRGIYTTNGWFTPQAQDVLVEKVRELAEKAGRKPAR